MPPSSPPPVAITIPVAWGEMDALGHVNNVVFFRYFECARVEYLRRLGWLDRSPATSQGFILHSVHARFRKPIVYPDILTVTARCVAIAPDRLTIEHTILSAAQSGALVAEGSGIVVCYDYANKTKAALTPELRAAIERAEGWGSDGPPNPASITPRG